MNQLDSAINEFLEFIRNTVRETVKEVIREEFREGLTIIEEPDSWMTLESLCIYLGDTGNPLPKSTIYGWVGKDHIPHHKRGKRLYFSKMEIDNWLKNG